MKPEVEAKVCEALTQLWMPVVYSFGFDELDIDNNDDRRRVLNEYPRIDDEQWNKLVDTVKRKLDDIVSVRFENNSLSIYLSEVSVFGKYFNIELTRESTDNLHQLNEFESDELDDMTKEEAMDYIGELYEIQESLPFEFVYSKINAGARFYLILDCNKFLNEIDAVRETLLKTPTVYHDALKAASIELQKKAEKQREIDNRIKAEKEEEARLLAEFAAKVEPLLTDAGWTGKYRVSMKFNNYVLSLRLTSYDECRYESITQSDVVSKIGELVNFANAYKFLKIAGGTPIVHGDQVRTADWKVIKG